MRALLIEDDPTIGEAVQDALKNETYAVDWARTGTSASTAPEARHDDLVVLDLGLPGRDGLDLPTDIRATGNSVPVVVVTARDALDDRLRGLGGGAGDYVLRPFEMSELLARLRAVLRRKKRRGGPTLGNGAVSLDPATRKASVHGAPPLQLTNREFALLRALLMRPGGILSRNDLEDRIYGWGEEVESSAVEYRIYSLRRKLGGEIIGDVRGMDGLKERLNTSIQFKPSFTLSVVIVGKRENCLEPKGSRRISGEVSFRGAMRSCGSHS
ncbi:TPA: response regulator transcription factor [Burkholderia aenigmatica]|uniref:response regulator n=1 Tax=Burkholderia sp. AU45251 TaxID=3059204 RepID=UPI00299A34B5|nr:response regulator transcription factor [Burkholderia aenigmatica]HDR9513979.1 response regulator transcription factor [Burkholderia aenigmatica]HDR9591369.1 response regulator transcription factor [Burkholderia aenigmatica]HDR9598461.1 response regulator transcription factor [Burkholderia aenigmatica]HDR9605893.1 response regulator transcription factor [Burkholderia aenigmatica]